MPPRGETVAQATKARIWCGSRRARSCARSPPRSGLLRRAAARNLVVAVTVNWGPDPSSRKGMYFDASRPSDLADAAGPHQNSSAGRHRAARPRARGAGADRGRASDEIRRHPIRRWTRPRPGYVLLIDQTRGDAAIRLGAANADSFAEMLAHAQGDHSRRAHRHQDPPRDSGEATAPGHFDPAALPVGVKRWRTGPIAPRRLFEGARAGLLRHLAAGVRGDLCGPLAP